jgi:DNA-binding MarR family transcriptional regulator
MSTIKPIAPGLGALLMDAARLFRTDFRRRAQHLGLTQPQWQAMAHLARAPGLSQAALAERLEVHPVTVTQQVDRLEAAGWVRREPHENDRRAFRLFLTDKAEPLISELWRLGSETRERALHGLSRAERAELDALLARVKTNLSNGDDAGHHQGKP